MQRSLLLIVVLVLTSLTTTLTTYALPRLQQNNDINENSDISAFYLTDNDTPQLGEHFGITLRIEAPSALTLQEVPPFPNDGDVFEILNTEDAIESEGNGRWRYEVVYDVIVWQVGEHTTPEQFVLFNGGQRLPIQSVTLTVASVLPTDFEGTLKNDFALRDLPYTSPWLYVGMGSGVVLLISLLLFRVRRRRQNSTLQSDTAQMTLARLQEIGETVMERDLAFALVANQLRQYLQARYEIRAVEMTTDELGEALQNTTLASEQRQQLLRLLEQADLVKFAQLTPTEEAMRQVIGFAMRWVKRVEQAWQVEQAQQDKEQNT
jgi:hypothetical protein